MTAISLTLGRGRFSHRGNKTINEQCRRVPQRDARRETNFLVGRSSCRSRRCNKKVQNIRKKKIKSSKVIGGDLCFRDTKAMLRKLLANWVIWSHWGAFTKTFTLQRFVFHPKRVSMEWVNPTKKCVNWHDHQSAKACNRWKKHHTLCTTKKRKTKGAKATKKRKYQWFMGVDMSSPARCDDTNRTGGDETKREAEQKNSLMLTWCL